MIDLSAAIEEARQRETERKAEEEREQREAERKRRLDRERYACQAFAELLGADFAALIVDFEHDPGSGRAWPALLFEGRQYRYEWRDHGHTHREHFWVRDDGARKFFNAESHASFADRRRDQALLALAACAKLPPPPPEPEGD